MLKKFQEFKHRRAVRRVLDATATLVRNETLIHGRYYVSVNDPTYTPSVCTGPRACAVGTLWLGAGIRPVAGDRSLPGVSFGARAPFIADKPVLADALEALNKAARAYVVRRGLKPTEDYGDKTPAETLAAVTKIWNGDAYEAFFESYDADRDSMLAVIANARKLV